MTNILDAICQKLAFLQLESHSVLDKHVANAFKKVEESWKIGGPQQNVIDDNSASKMKFFSRKPGVVKGLPFVAKDAHHACVERRCIAGAKRHDGPTIFVIVGGEERQLFLILLPNTDLVITGLVVKSNKEEEAIRVTEVVDGVITTGDRVLKRECCLVKAPIRNTKSPDEVGDGQDMFLMWLSGQNDGRAPRTKAFPYPPVILQHFEVFHDNFAFMRSVMWFAAANRWGGTCVDGELEV